MSVSGQLPSFATIKDQACHEGENCSVPLSIMALSSSNCSFFQIEFFRITWSSDLFIVRLIPNPARRVEIEY